MKQQDINNRTAYIERGMQQGAELLDKVKQATANDLDFHHGCKFSREAQGWLILSLFGRLILLRTEVTWENESARCEVVVYVDEREFEADKPGNEWKAIGVTAAPFDRYESEEGAELFPAWHLIEGILLHFYSKKTVFRSLA